MMSADALIDTYTLNTYLPTYQKKKKKKEEDCLTD